MPKVERRSMIEKEESPLSIVKQCNLLTVNRSGFYYKSKPTSVLNLELMKEMDKHYLDYPFKGAGRMHTYLHLDLGYNVSRNRIDRLYYKVMGLRSILPGPHTSKRCKGHQVYPYLLRGLEVKRSNQVWAIDITYIPMPKGFLYLTAIIDLYSRYVIHWSLSNTMDAQWCADVYSEAVELYGAPQIINTDQGSQFTSVQFTDSVRNSGAKLSMDGKGRATDNAFIERLWRTVKYEYVYIHAHQTGQELFKGLTYFFEDYNQKRRHSSIGNKYPQDLYKAGRIGPQSVKAA